MLETLREYGWERLADSGELTEVRQRHRDWYLQLAEQAEAAASSPGQAMRLARMEAELDNFRVALAGCREEAEAHPNGAAAENGVRLAVALWPLWFVRGYLAEGLKWLEWLEGVIARGDRLPAPVRALACQRAAYLAQWRGDEERERTLFQTAREEQEKVVARARTAGDPGEIAQAVLRLSQLALESADPEAAWIFGTEARQRMRALGDLVGLADALEWLAATADRRGERTTCQQLQEERLAICRQLGDPHLLIHALGAMGHFLRDGGDYPGARSVYVESLALRRQHNYRIAIAQSLEDLAVLAGRQGQAERAIRLLGAGEAFCETLGARPPVAIAGEYERTTAESRAALGEAAFAAAWAEGRAMSLEQAIEDALGDA
jgi:non-specific serine/threonine protein kinase